MVTVFYTPNFIRRYKHLESSLKKEVKEKIKEFENPKNHKKLDVHKLTGRLDHGYAFSVNFKIRIIFEYRKSKSQANLLSIGDHDELYR